MSTRVVLPSPAVFAEAAAILRSGGVVGVPTETVYGLAAALDSADGLARVFEVKARPRFDPLIVHVAVDASAARESLSRAHLLDPGRVTEVAAAVFDGLAAAYWPGPLTLVVPRGRAVPDLVTAGLDTVALRAPAHPVARALLAALGGPFAAPSANRFGRVSPTTAEHVRVELDGRVPLVLDGGPCEVGLESTVVRVEPDGALTLLRAGAVGATELARFSPIRESAPERAGEAASAPGRLASHYAPGSPVSVFERAASVDDTVAWVLGLAPPPGAVVLLLSADPALASAFHAALGPTARVAALGASPEARAHALFATLRALDGASAILAERPGPDAEGLDHAIRDRLTRAATRAEP